MLLEITHETDLSYSDLISESVMELRVAPRQDADQHRLSFDLAIGPPTGVTSYFDWLGNTVHAFAINRFHKQIKIVATSVVETDRPSIDVLSLPDTWPIETHFGYELFDYLQFGGPIVDEPRVRQLAYSLNPRPGMKLGELALRLCWLVSEKFEYQQGITSAASPITDLLDHGKGVCQDFTHLMTGMARALGIPARYVSGLVHTDRKDFRGAAQTHAWVELMFPSRGWVGFDPTNRCVTDANFVEVAVGRYFADVAPNRGIYKGQAKESIDVRVTSKVLTEIPGELAAERLVPIDIPAYPAGSPIHRQLAKAAFEMQQQQQQ
jgi:transglutaminase-like putative cysteine protease